MPPLCCKGCARIIDYAQAAAAAFFPPSPSKSYPVRLAEEELPERETHGLTLLGRGADATSTMSLRDHVHDAKACARSRGRYFCHSERADSHFLKIAVFNAK